MDNLTLSQFTVVTFIAGVLVGILGMAYIVWVVPPATAPEGVYMRDSCYEDEYAVTVDGVIRACVPVDNTLMWDGDDHTITR